MAVDGSEDSELDIRDLPGITVGDWRLQSTEDTGATGALEMKDQEQSGPQESGRMDSDEGEVEDFDTGSDSEVNNSEIDADAEMDMEVIYE